jgi:hypothetical protein
MIEALPATPGPDDRLVMARRRIESEALLVIKKATELGAGERRMMRELLGKIQEKPAARRLVLRALLRYAQIRYLYDSAQSPGGSEFPVQASR